MWYTLLFFVFVPTKKGDHDESFKGHRSRSIKNALIRKQRMFKNSHIHSNSLTTILEQCSRFQDSLISTSFRTVINIIEFGYQGWLLILMQLLSLTVQQIDCYERSTPINAATISPKLSTMMHTNKYHRYAFDNITKFENVPSSSRLCLKTKRRMIPVFPDDDSQICTSTQEIEVSTSHMTSYYGVTSLKTDLMSPSKVKSLPSLVKAPFNETTEELSTVMEPLDDFTMELSDEHIQPPDMKFPDEDTQPPDMKFPDEDTQPPDMKFPDEDTQPPDMKFPDEDTQPPDMKFPDEDTQAHDMKFPADGTQSPDMVRSDENMQPSDITIEASFQLVRNVRAIRNEPENIITSINVEPFDDELIFEPNGSTSSTSTQIAYTSDYYVSTTILPTFQTNTTRIFLTLEEIARQQFEMLTGFVSYALANFTVECIPDIFINCTINSTHRIQNCTDTVLEDPYNSTTNGTNNNTARLTQLWYDATHADERLDDYASSIHYCFEHGWCSNTTVYFDSVINLPDIWKAIVAPVEQLIATMGSEFNVSTEATRFGGGNTTGCQPGFTKYSEPKKVVDDWWGDEEDEEEGDGCEPIDKYMISLWELWYEYAKPAYFMLDVLTDLNVQVVNTTVNCSLYHNLTELGYNHTRINYTLTMEDYYYIHMNNSMQEVEKFRANFCSFEPDYSGFNETLLSYYNYSIELYNMSMNGTLNVTVPPPPPCILVIPDTCHEVRDDNETFMEMLHRHELNWTDPDVQISANCSAYDIQGFENLTFYEMWDEMRQPRDHVLNILKNITTVLKLITVNCSNYDYDIHENITLSRVWTQFESTRRDILDILDVIYYRLPNVTVICYDYPYNITIEAGIDPPWWHNPLIWFISGGSVSFIIFIVVWVRVCIYCQKYCETYIPGSEEKKKLEALYAKQAQIYLRKKHWQDYMASKGLPDPNRSPQRKRKKLVRELTEEEKRTEWILRHMDNMPSMVLENPYAEEG